MRASLKCLALLVLAQPTWAVVGAGTNLFSAGRTRLSINGGYARTNEKDYFVASLGAGYYVAEGLEVGVDGDAWMGNSPRLYKVSPQAKYVMPDLGGFRPYAGGFYRRTFYETDVDYSSVGGRGGLIWSMGGNASASAGIVFERQLNCDKNLVDHCSLTYPEAGFSINF